MPDDLLELDLDDDGDDDTADDTAVDNALLADLDAPKDDVKAPIEFKLDSSDLGRTISDALSGANAEQTATIRALAQEFISSQSKPDAPKATREQIASRNATIQAALMDTTGDVDLLETIKGLVRPVIEESISGTLRDVRPQADNLSASQGERLVRDFKRDIRDSVNEKLYSRYEAEIDKLIPESKLALIAQATPKARKEFFEEIEERTHGRVYRAALNDKTPRGQNTGSGGGGKGNQLQQAFNSLPREEQREADKLAKAFARAKGLVVGSKEYQAAYSTKVQDYIEG